MQYNKDFHSSRKNNHSPQLVFRVFGLLGTRAGLAIIFIVLIAIVAIQDAVFPFLNKLLIDEGLVLKNMDRLLEIIIYYGIIAVFQAFCVFGFISLAGLLGEGICFDLRDKMFTNLQRLSFSFFNKNPAGKIISRITSDSSKIAELISWGTLSIVWGGINIISSVIFMMFIDWKLALIVCGAFPIIISLAIVFQNKIFSQFRIVRKCNSRVTTIFNENITGQRVVKAFCREEENNKEFEKVTGEMYHAAFRAAWLSAVFLPLIQLIGTFTIAVVIWMGGWNYSIAGISIGGIQAFISYVAFMLWPVREIARVWASMQNAMAAGERVFHLMDEVPEIRNKPGACDPVSLKQQIRFHHVSFSYSPEEEVLRDFNLIINPGQTIALVGPTGSGKTTIINLMCRFYEPAEGEIQYNGVDYREFTLEGLQAGFGIVLQTPHLFSGTIKENILYGSSHSSDEDVEKAARLTQAHRFITSLPGGYNTPVGEGGSLLSVGQKQLISLTRAVIADPDIFIMDEATSSIDTYTENLIQLGLKGIMKSRTSIIIAHRLSTVQNADRILVLEKGRIIEDGSHRELMEKKQKYYQLYSLHKLYPQPN